MNSNSNNGATSALRGYRTQFLFTLYRILIAEKEEVVFPEGYEDYCVKDAGDITEVVQVKDLSSPLQLSNFKPKSKDSFFRRCIALLEKGESPQFKVVSFGELGKELKIFQETGESVPMREKLLAYQYDANLVTRLFGCLQIVSVREEIIKEEVDQWLSDTLVATNPDIALDLLHFWIYRLAEQQLPIDCAQLIEKIGEIATFLNERHRFLTEFGRSILQLGDKAEVSTSKTLQEQYNSGVAAQYVHILADLDIQRPEKMEAIHEAFKLHSLVIVHGASGQGKSTLAYRYLHDYYPSSYVYCITSTTDLAQVLDITQAIKALARPFQEAFIIYLDVAPGNQYWLNLCQYLIDIPLCRILVTIREEDLHRSDSPHETLDPWELSLQLTEGEAAFIYDQFQQQFPIPHFLNFLDAWSRFGGKGPLLEFIYFLRQGERLENRLANQLKRIENLAAIENDPAQVDLLRFLATAGAHDCRLNLVALLQKLKLANPKRTLAFFEDEYLFRTSSDGRYLEALHPIRARLMMKILCDPVIIPAETVLGDCFPLVIEEDWGNFILQFAYKFRWPDQMMEKLLQLIPKEWRTCQEVLSGLVWCGVRKYIDQNASQLEQLRMEFPLGFDLAMMILLAPQVDLSVLKNIFPQERKERLDEILAQFTPVEEFYYFAKSWIGACQFPSDIDTSSAAEVGGLGYILFWQNHLNQLRPLNQQQLERLTELETEELPIEPLADLLLGLQHHSNEGKVAAGYLLPGFLRKYQAYGKVAWLEEIEDGIKVHFIIPLNEESESYASGTFNERAMYLLRLTRKVYPFYSQYSSQGYGHHFSSIPLPYDESQKNISAQALPLPWITDAGQIFRNLTSWQTRLEDWQSLITKLQETKMQIANSIESFLIGLKHLGKQKRLEKPWEIISGYPKPDSFLKLPQEAVDPWGYINDFTSNQFLSQAFHDVPLLQILFPKLESHFKAIKDFHTSIRNFLDQAHKSLAIKEVSQDWTKTDWREKEGKLRELGYARDNLRLSKYNLQKALEQLDDYLEALATISEWNQQPWDHIESEILKEKLSQLLIVWCYFVQIEPFRKTNLFRASRSWQNGVISEFEQKLNKQLRKLQKQEGLQDAEYIRSNESESNWYILLYIDNWAQTLNCSNKMHSLLRECLVPTPIQSAKRQILSQSIQKIWVVPLCGDYLVSRNTIGFDLYHILDKEEKELGVTLYGEVTDEMIAELDLDVAWEPYPEFVSAERFNKIVQSIPLSLEYILQLETLWNRSETGNMLVEVSILNAVQVVHKVYQELPALVEQLTNDVQQEMTQTIPYIPDQNMISYLGSILQQTKQIEELVKILSDDGITDTFFRTTEDLKEHLSGLSSEILLLYWSWLDLLIHQNLKK